MTKEGQIPKSEFTFELRLGIGGRCGQCGNGSEFVIRTSFVVRDVGIRHSRRDSQGVSRAGAFLEADEILNVGSIAT
jgi:hypothetical protein